MELREYWTILMRRWWIPALLVLAVGLLSLLQLRPWQPAPPTYTASLRMLVGVMPLEDADTTAYDPRYYGWLTSEYLVDDFTEVVRSGLFAGEVSARLAEGVDSAPIEVPPGAIQGSAATGKLHRIITLSFAWPDAAELETIANAAAVELSEDAADYFLQLGTEGAGVTLIDGPSVGAVGPSLRSRLELPLRLLLALVVGIGLAFLLEYLDTRLRSADEVEALGLPVIGRIPRA
jgi:capsular polysaccharide biosynthesis protein